jgi:fumarate reductase flavoprotein subunit
MADVTAPAEQYDLIVVGAGTAGIPCAVAAADEGARVLLVEKDSRIGGSLYVTGGHMAAGGTSLQRERGISDSPAEHLEDIRRISGGSAREDLTNLLVDNAVSTIEWLAEHGFAFASDSPRIIYGHEPYRIPRTHYGRDEGLSILEVFRPELERAQRERDLILWLSCTVTELITADDGAVAGVRLFRQGQESAAFAPAVVLATGGYGSDPDLFAELDEAPLVSAASPTSTGDGIYLGRAVGAGLQGQGTYLPTFGGLPDPRRPGRSNWSDRQMLTSERAPWEIYVDESGKRWVAEDEESIDAKERALTKLANMTFWTVFDDTALAQASGGTRQMVVGKEPDQIRAWMNVRPGFHSSDTLTDLANLAGINVDGLVATVSTYNEAVAAGRDAEFGRVHLPAQIKDPPFYAIRNHAITLVTFQGLDINDSFEVLGEDKQAIRGLYAVGEVIGAGATCGNSFCSGMLVTPAITFGRLLGRRIGRSVGRSRVVPRRDPSQ